MFKVIFPFIATPKTCTCINSSKLKSCKIKYHITNFASCLNNDYTCNNYATIFNSFKVSCFLFSTFYDTIVENMTDDNKIT